MLEQMLAIADARGSALSWLSLSQRGLDGLVEKALVLAEADQLPDAIRIMEDLVIAERSSALIPFLLGTLYAAAKDSRAAALIYTEALNRSARAGGSASFAAEVQLMRAREWLRLGALDAAVEDLQAAGSSDGPVRDKAQLLLSRVRKESAA